jgi:drug/metabolite transporter (DMT)-like permease
MKLLIILAVTLWASTFVGIRAAVIDFTPIDIAVLRFIVSSITLLAISIFQKVSFPNIKNLLLLILLGAILFVNYIALNYGTKTITAGETTLLVSTSQLFQVLLAYLFLKEAISPRFLVGLFVCFLGIVVISFQNSKGLSFSWGVFFVLIAAITNAIFFILQKPLLKKNTPLEVVSYSTWIASILLLPGIKHVLASFQTSALNSSIGVVYIGIASVIANLCWSKVLSKTDASKAATFLYLVPVITIIIGFIWLQEYPSFISCLGGVLIIGGVVVANSKPTEQAHTPNLTRRYRSG